MESGKYIQGIPIATDEFWGRLREIVKEEIRDKQRVDIEEKLCSPSETCNLFQPKISKVTLAKWTKEGRIQEHRIGGRIYYKYSEVISSLETLKKYKKS